MLGSVCRCSVRSTASPTHYSKIQATIPSPRKEKKELSESHESRGRRSGRWLAAAAVPTRERNGRLRSALISAVRSTPLQLPTGRKTKHIAKRKLAKPNVCVCPDSDCTCCRLCARLTSQQNQRSLAVAAAAASALAPPPPPPLPCYTVWPGLESMSWRAAGFGLVFWSLPTVQQHIHLSISVEVKL